MAYQELFKIYNEQKAKFYAKIVAEDCMDTRRFYQVMRSKRKPVAVLPRLMTKNGKLLVGDARISAIAASLSEVFVTRISRFSKIQNVAHIQMREIYLENFNVSNSVRWQNFNITFSIDEIRKSLMEISSKKDPGPMEISARMLQYCIDTTAPLLFDIINSVVQTGFVPESWLNSFVTPIPKAGDISDISNYRGIAQQSVIPKLLDKLLTAKLRLHWDQYLPEQQHGFRKHRGTVSNLLEVTLNT